MDIFSLAISLVVGGTIAFVIATLLNKSKSVPKSEFNEINAKLSDTNSALSVSQSREGDLRKANEILTGEKKELADQLATVREENAGLSVENRTMKNSQETQKTEIEALHKKSILEFENLANKILETKREEVHRDKSRQHFQDTQTTK